MSSSKKKTIMISVVVLVCILLNISLGFATEFLKLGLFMDTIGTMLTSALCGSVPGIFVAIVTNFVLGLSDNIFFYYGLINVLIALITSFVFRKFQKIKVVHLIGLLFAITLIATVITDIFINNVTGFNLDREYSTIVFAIFNRLPFQGPISIFISIFLTELLDKSISIAISYALIKIIPEKIREDLYFTGWKQTPIEYDEAVKLERGSGKFGSLKSKITTLMTFAAVFLGIIATIISMVLFRKYTIDQHSDIANGVAAYVAEIVDGDKVDEYLEKGEAAPGYKEIEKLMYSVKETSKDIEYVYVYQIKEDGCHVVFDLDTEEVEGGNPGDLIEFDEAFLPFLPKLLAGEEIDPIISDETFGWLLTVYKPVYDSNGECVCYACVDVSMRTLNVYERDFLIKLLAIYIGFFIFILSISIWFARYHIIYPVDSMSKAASEFAYDSNESRQENVNLISSLDIHTGDEIEKLYYSLLQTTDENFINYVELNRKTEAMDRLQKGLIIVLADMVENRDESTGDHVRKTAAYTRVIMESLKKKGYYTDQLTDAYMDDVERSAPLHDVGKIQIPDAILNKPGKLTDMEYDIMKTHTTRGQAIIEQVIQSLPESEYLEEAKNISGGHHEKWNGTGYPKGLAGEDIPLSARIMAVADVFDALVSVRCYKRAFTFDEAMNIIKKDAGTHFDPKVAEAFIDASDEVKKILDYYTELRETDNTDEKKD